MLFNQKKDSSFFYSIIFLTLIIFFNYSKGKLIFRFSMNSVSKLILIAWHEKSAKPLCRASRSGGTSRTLVA